MSTTPTPTPTPTLSRDRVDLLESLATHRFLLLRTVDGIDDAQAALRPTASALCLGGIIRHVTWGERNWTRFITDGPAAIDPAARTEEFLTSFAFGAGDSLAAVVDAYTATAAATDALVADLDDLDADHALPPAPWFRPGARYSARRTLLHIIGETAQHAGHADIIRESIDGARSMG